MPAISLHNSEVIKHRLLLARRHLDRVRVKVPVFRTPRVLEQADLRLLASATYELNRAMGLSAVKHGDDSATGVLLLEDTIYNLDAALATDLTLAHVTSPPFDPDHVLEASAQILRGVLSLPVAS